MRFIIVAVVLVLAVAAVRAANANAEEQFAALSNEIASIDTGAAADGAPRSSSSSIGSAEASSVVTAEDTTSEDESEEEALPDADAVASRATGLSTADCSPSVVLATLVTFFAGASVVLLMAIIMNYRLLAAMSGAAGYASLDGTKPELSRAQRAVLIIASILVIAATITVAVVFSVMAPAAAPAAPGTTARAGAAAGLAAMAPRAINVKRGSLKKGLPGMRWSASDASVAQGYVNRCPGLVHNARRGKRGENIYVYSAAGGDPNAHMQNAVNAWWAEIAYYNYRTNTCQAGKMCGMTPRRCVANFCAVLLTHARRLQVITRSWRGSPPPPSAVPSRPTAPAGGRRKWCATSARR